MRAWQEACAQLPVVRHLSQGIAYVALLIVQASLLSHNCLENKVAKKPHPLLSKLGIHLERVKWYIPTPFDVGLELTNTLVGNATRALKTLGNIHLTVVLGRKQHDDNTSGVIIQVTGIGQPGPRAPSPGKLQERHPFPF